MNDTMKSQIIINEVCKHFGVTESELHTKCRSRTLTDPRHFIYYFCREYTDMGFKRIGLIFRQDHSSVIHACNTVPELIRYNGYSERASRIKGAILERIGMDDIEKWSLQIAQL